MRVRGRRGAAFGKDLARVKLQRVLMMVRVVNAFRQFTDRLRALTPIIRSRTTSPDYTTGNNPPGNGATVDAAALAAAYTAFPCTEKSLFYFRFALSRPARAFAFLIWDTELCTDFPVVL